MDVTHCKQLVNQAIVRATAASPFLRLLLERSPDVAQVLADGRIDEALSLAARAGEGVEVTAALRRTRSAHALVLGIADLAGLMELEEVTRRLSHLADDAIATALDAALAERVPLAPAGGFAVIALGKLGSCELNYSSDVDLLLLFDPHSLPRRPREEPGQAAIRVGQRLVELLQKRTEDGYAFRVDLRLRPSPEVTPIVLPVDAAISYYESSALPWERAAFIRARHVAGDAALGRYFLRAIHPFVWRRSLDYGAVEELGSITGRIRDHYAERQSFGPGYDLKRGRGGIRDVEFYAQTHQLIHGGRDPALRVPASLDALEALAAAGRIEQHDALVLREAYRTLRTIEHRLQMVDDRQTHSLPQATEDLANVARLHGLSDGEALLDLLRPHVTRVAAIHGTLDADGDGEAPLPRDGERLAERLAQAGFADPAAARARVESWRSGRARSLRTPAAMQAFEALLPGLVAALGAAPDPMRALNRFDHVVERLPSGINFYRLLEARPGLAQHLGVILSHAPALADQLGRRPELLDGLIDASAFEPPPDVAALVESFGEAERPSEDYQQLLDRTRRRVNEARFALGAQLVLARTDPLEVAHGYGRVAEAAVRFLARATVSAFEAAHGKVQGSELLILGLGRLGGGALTHASDLDLIYLFSGTHDAGSDGPRPLRATDYFNRLAARVSAALSVPTAAGPLYEVDTRLRPSGRDGMLAVSVDSFARYQQEAAWTFEHMALTRARPLFGSAEAQAALTAEIRSVLLRERDPAKAVEDAVRMRAEIAVHKPPTGPFDIKLGDGGLVDLEFAVQVLQLTRGLGLQPGTEAALAELEEAGLVALTIPAAYRLLTRMLVTLRLVSPDAAEPPPPTRALVATACGLADWEELLAAHAAARQAVLALWRQVSQG